MNDLFINIGIDHEKCIGECARAMLKNIAIASSLKESDGCAAFLQICPNKDSYTSKMTDLLSATRDNMQEPNKKCIDDCKDAAEKNNPIGMEVPRCDCKSDDEIKDQYKKLQTVLLDKFNECADIVKEGGEGWIRFIDTLATPEERVQNYMIPKFDSTYNIFYKEKKVNKVTRPDLTKAIKTICDYDRSMGQLIKEAEDFDYEYNKKFNLMKEYPPADSLTEASKYIAEVMLLVEQDFLTAQSLETRRYALSEEVKTAHKLLYGIATHNPRDIKESSIRRDINMSIVETRLDNVFDNPVKDDKVISVDEAGILDQIDKLRANCGSSNKKFLDKYKEAALKSNCKGVFIDKWLEPKEFSKPIAQSIAILINTTKMDRLEELDEANLEKLYKSVKYFSTCVSNANLKAKKPDNMSPAIQKAINILPFLSDKDTFGTKAWLNVTKNHAVTKWELKECIKYLENMEKSVSSLYSDCQKQMNQTELYLYTKIPISLKSTKKGRLIVKITKTKELIISMLNTIIAKAAYNQASKLQSQSRTVIMKAARVVKESTLEEENKNIEEVNSYLNEMFTITADMIHNTILSEEEE